MAVSATAAVGRLTIAVEDEGPAIPNVEASVLTGDQDMADVYHGNGLGLWLVYWVVELCDYWVEVTDGEDGDRQKGTPTFSNAVQSCTPEINCI